MNLSFTKIGGYNYAQYGSESIKIQLPPDDVVLPTVLRNLMQINPMAGTCLCMLKVNGSIWYLVGRRYIP